MATGRSVHWLRRSQSASAARFYFLLWCRDFQRCIVCGVRERRTRNVLPPHTSTHHRTRTIYLCVALARLRCSSAALFTSTRARQLARHHHRTHVHSFSVRPSACGGASSQAAAFLSAAPRIAFWHSLLAASPFLRGCVVALQAMGAGFPSSCCRGLPAMRVNGCSSLDWLLVRLLLEWWLQHLG